MSKELQTNTFKPTTPKDLEDDLRYFWSKTESIVKQLEGKGYIVNLNPGRIDVRESEVKKKKGK